MMLRAQEVTRNFGGLMAVDGVSLAFALGRVHAIIGPNGAGKTTLINMLSGDLAPTSGHIFYGEHEITALPAHRISRLGIGRSYQKTNIFPNVTCYQNAWLAAQSRMTTSMRFIRPAGRYREVDARAMAALDMVGLSARAGAVAAEISHGEQRQLEIAMLLATEPRVLLLDEPTAGMGPEESEGVVALIKRLAADHCIVLIEHDMDAVFAVADELTVLVNGRVLDSGPPDAIRANPTVREAYLGDELLEE